MADLIRHLLNRKRTIFRFPSFSLERKVSEKTRPPPSDLPAQPSRVLAFPVWENLMRHFCFCTTPKPKSLIADLPLSKGVPEGRGIKVPRSPTLLGLRPLSLLHYVIADLIRKSKIRRSQSPEVIRLFPYKALPLSPSAGISALDGEACLDKANGRNLRKWRD